MASPRQHSWSTEKKTQIIHALEKELNCRAYKKEWLCFYLFCLYWYPKSANTAFYDLSRLLPQIIFLLLFSFSKLLLSLLPHLFPTAPSSVSVLLPPCALPARLLPPASYFSLLSRLLHPGSFCCLSRAPETDGKPLLLSRSATLCQPVGNGGWREWVWVAVS